MRKILANSTIAVGIAMLIYVLVWLLGLLPIDFMLPAAGQATSRYWRVIPTASQNAFVLPSALAVFGLVLLMAGVALRRRLRSAAPQ